MIKNLLQRIADFFTSLFSPKKKPNADSMTLGGTLCKQETLKGTGGTAYESACVVTSAKVCAEIMTGKRFDLVEFFTEAVQRGFIDNTIYTEGPLKGKNKCYVESYEGLFSIAGLKGVFMIGNYSGNETKISVLVKSGIPVIVFIGSPGHLDHAELVNGINESEAVTLLTVLDPGWQNDENLVLATGNLFHMAAGKRSYSVLPDGKIRRVYKFGYLEKI